MNGIFCSRKVLGSLVLATAATASIPAHALAGLVSFGVKGGLNFTSQDVKISDVNQSNYKNSLGWLAGGGVDIGMGVAGLEIDALYAVRKIKESGTTITRNAIFLPAIVKFGLGPMFLGAGGYYSLGVGKINSGGTSTTYKVANIKKGDYGLTGALGAQFMGFGVEARYNYGLGNVSDAASTSSKTRSVDLLVSYWF